jgi:hypothetical protein
VNWHLRYTIADRAEQRSICNVFRTMLCIGEVCSPALASHQIAGRDGSPAGER